MPRTKVTARPARDTENIKPNSSKLDQLAVDAYLKALDDAVAEKDRFIENELNRIKQNLHNKLREVCLRFPLSSCNKTIAELKLDPPEIASIIETTALKNITVNSTKSMHNTKYNTTAGSEVNRDASLRSKLHSNIKKAKNTRASRSLSRSKLQQAFTTMNSFNTPASQNITAGSFGLVTPKIKPNRPQVLLRHPKLGETVISMQGSPLMVTRNTDQKPTVNIPLLDGRVLSIQPQRGLRTSQIPNIDLETQRQIETLRDNLNKVCAFTARR